MKYFFLFLAATISINAHSDILNLKAEYEIPVLNSDDLNLNKFKIDHYQIDVRSAADATLTFTFPEDMVGRLDQKFTFKSTSILADNTKVLSGPNGKALCKGKWAEAQCSFVLKKVKINTLRLKEILNQKLNPEDSEKQLKILVDFSNDPIGVSKFIF